MSNEQNIYTIIAMTKHFSNPGNTNPTDTKTYQVMISCADCDRERPCWHIAEVFSGIRTS
jgi:hypothetical protein